MLDCESGAVSVGNARDSDDMSDGIAMGSGTATIPSGRSQLPTSLLVVVEVHVVA